MHKCGAWSSAQVDYLEAHYPAERAEDVGAAIGRSKRAVQHMASRLGIQKDKEKFFDFRSAWQKGEKSRNYKGFRRRTTKGYITIYLPNHPYASKSGLVMEHRVVMESSIGRYLQPTEDIHHINGVKDDNRIENLQLISHAEHTTLHNLKGAEK